MYVVEVPAGDAHGTDGENGPDTTDGTVVRIAVRELDEQGVVRVSHAGERTAVRASRSFGAMLGTLRPLAQNVVSTFRSLDDPPEEIAVEFGISLSADADIVVASTTAEATFAVSLTWRGAGSPAADAAGGPADPPAVAAPTP